MDTKNYKPKVSLIIPVYNVENYLARSLKSAVDQTMKDIEIIVVNDGSTDKSPEIINEFANKYDNIIVINQNNMGLSGARNTGLKNAKADYIAFMDSDDFIDKKFIETLYNMAIKYNADIAYCNYYMYFPEKDSSQCMPFTSRNAIYSNKTALKKLIMDTTLHHYAWNKLYKKSLFSDNKIEFYNIFFEDVATIPRLFYYANKVAVTKKALYYYTKRKGSIINSVSTKKMNDYIRSIGVLRNFLKDTNSYESYKLAFKIYAYRSILVNWYFIVDMHTRMLNFNSFFKNIKNSTKSTYRFIDDKYNDKEKVPDIAYPIEPPKLKHHKSKGKIKKSSFKE